MQMMNYLYHIFWTDSSESKKMKHALNRSATGKCLRTYFMFDLLHQCYTTVRTKSVATFSDDTAVLAVGKHHEEAANKLGASINQISNWTKTWLIQLN